MEFGCGKRIPLSLVDDRCIAFIKSGTISRDCADGRLQEDAGSTFVFPIAARKFPPGATKMKPDAFEAYPQPRSVCSFPQSHIPPINDWTPEHDLCRPDGPRATALGERSRLYRAWIPHRVNAIAMPTDCFHPLHVLTGLPLTWPPDSRAGAISCRVIAPTLFF